MGSRASTEDKPPPKLPDELFGPPGVVETLAEEVLDGISRQAPCVVAESWTISEFGHMYAVCLLPPYADKNGDIHMGTIPSGDNVFALVPAARMMSYMEYAASYDNLSVVHIVSLGLLIEYGQRWCKLNSKSTSERMYIRDTKGDKLAGVNDDEPWKIEGLAQKRNYPTNAYAEADAYNAEKEHTPIQLDPAHVLENNDKHVTINLETKYISESNQRDNFVMDMPIEYVLCLHERSMNEATDLGRRKDPSWVVFCSYSNWQEYNLCF